MLLLILLAALVRPIDSAQPRIIILGYHEVEDDGLPPHAVIPRGNAAAPTDDEMARYTVSTEAFREQMDALEAHGYEVVPLADVIDYLTGRRATLPARSAVITVDDGWRSTSTEIAPELAKRDWPFTAFVYPRVVEQHAHHPFNLRWSEIDALVKKGADVESHTYSHPFLTRAGSLDDELNCSRDVIAAHTGQPVRFLAYPYGDYDDGVIAAAKAAGYEGAVTVKPGLVTRRSDPFALERYLLHHDTTLPEFERWLEAR